MSMRLGITGSVATAKVLEAVRPYQLYAVETAGIAEIEVTRASRVIGGKDIESRIARAFAGQYGLGDAKRLTVNLEREAHAIYVDPNSTAELEVTRSSFDPRSGRFDISFDLTGTVATSRAPLRFTGTLFEGVEAAVLTRPLGRGEIVKAADVTIERRPKSEVANDTIASLDQIVGFSARQALRAGQVLRRGDVLKADVVQRNDAVTLVYEVPGIVLTVRGKAVDAGAEGDVIGVLNVQTKRTVQGTVAGPGRVIVTPAPAISSAVVAAQVPSTE
jgi:flagella basal body P-ring formation protein FlgA